jgi:phage-related protein
LPKHFYGEIIQQLVEDLKYVIKAIIQLINELISKLVDDTCDHKAMDSLEDNIIVLKNIVSSNCEVKKGKVR